MRHIHNLIRSIVWFVLMVMKISCGCDRIRRDQSHRRLPYQPGGGGVPLIDTAHPGVSIADEMAADAAEIFQEFGDRVEFRGREIPALVSEPDTLTEPVPGGFGEAGNLTVKILRTALPDGPPRHGEPLRYAERGYRIVRVMDRPTRPLITLTVEPEDG